MDIIKMEEEGDSSLPCVICGDDVPRSPVEDDIVIVTRKLKDDPIFQCFLKLFKIKDFEGNDEPDSSYKFCGSCKLHLGNLLDIQIKVDQLQKQITIGTEHLKRKVERSEGTFESEEIYECYPRYRKVRGKIIDQAGSHLNSKNPVAILNNQQKITFKSIGQLEQEPESPSIPDFVDLNYSANESEDVEFPTQQPTNKKNEPTQPRKNFKFVESVEKQLVLYGDFTFNTLESSEKGKGQVKCSICDLIIPYTKGCIKGHVLKAHTNSFVCSQCPSRFSRGRHLRSHVQSVHKGQPRKGKIIECTICKKPISSRNRKQHEWSHKSKAEKEEALKDPKIPKSFLNEKNYHCDKCEDRFSCLSQLKKHEDRKHMDPEERKELCPKCGKTFLNLSIHLRDKHPKEEEGVVDLMKTCLEPGCGKRFGNLGDLTRHKNQVHRKLKPFECTHCGKCFGGKGNLKEHMKCHILKINPL